jgi:hypothetical protein
MISCISNKYLIVSFQKYQNGIVPFRASWHPTFGEAKTAQKVTNFQKSTSLELHIDNKH